MESRCTCLPDNDSAAITQRSYELTAHTVSLVCSQRDFNSKDLLIDDDKLHCQGLSSKSIRNQDSISPKKARSDSANDSSQEGSNGGDGSSDVDSNGNNNGDESDNGSDTANDNGDNGGHGSRRCDPDYTPSETDKEKERPNNISSDDESDDRHRPRKRCQVTKDQASDQTRRAKVRQAKSRSCSSPAPSPSRQLQRVGTGFAPSPPTSHDMSGLETKSDKDSIMPLTASFSEWQLHDAILKSVMINSATAY